MFGPGTGHNIVRFLDYFKEHPKHELTYYHYNGQKHFNLDDYQPQITFISPYALFKLIRAIKNKQDLLWIHNWTPWPILILVRMFAKKSTIVNFNVWSEALPKMVKSGGVKASFYRSFFRYCDTLQCTWFSTLNLLKAQGFTNTVMLRWGMVEEKFTDLSELKPSAFTSNFIDSIDPNKYNFFFPKSVSGGNRHDLIVEACKKLVDEGYKDFKIYFWLGNFNRSEQLDLIESQIKEFDISEQIAIIHHEFVSHEEIHLIWSKMDCGLQVLDADQLSTSFQEPQLYLKEIIASNIPSYQLFQKEFNVELNLIENTTESLHLRMKGLLEGEQTSEIELEKRKSVFENHYRFTANMPKILDYFSNLKA